MSDAETPIATKGCDKQKYLNKDGYKRVYDRTPESLGDELPLASNCQVDEKIDEDVDEDAVKQREEEARSCSSYCWCLHRCRSGQEGLGGCWTNVVHLRIGLRMVEVGSRHDHDASRAMWGIGRAAIRRLCGEGRLSQRAGRGLRRASTGADAAAGALPERSLVGWDGFVGIRLHVLVSVGRLGG